MRAELVAALVLVGALVPRLVEAALPGLCGINLYYHECIPTSFRMQFLRFNIIEKFIANLKNQYQNPVSLQNLESGFGVAKSQIR